MTTPIEEYEVHPFYPTRFLRWALVPVDNATTGIIASYKCRVLQQKWRNISGDEKWLGIPEVLIEPNVTVEEVPEPNQVLSDKNLSTNL